MSRASRRPPPRRPIAGAAPSTTTAVPLAPQHTQAAPARRAYRERDTKHNRSRAARHAKPHGAAESTRKAGPVTGQNAEVELHDATPALSRRVAMERPVRRAR